MDFINKHTKIFKVIGATAEYQENRIIIKAECETQITKNGWGTEEFVIAKICKDWKEQGNYTYFQGTDKEKEYKTVKPVLKAIWKWMEKINKGYIDNIFSFDESKVLRFTGINK